MAASTSYGRPTPGVSWSRTRPSIAKCSSRTSSAPPGRPALDVEGDVGVEALSQGAREDFVQIGPAGGFEAELEQGKWEFGPAEQSLDDVVHVVDDQIDRRLSLGQRVSRTVGSGARRSKIRSPSAPSRASRVRK